MAHAGDANWSAPPPNKHIFIDIAPLLCVPALCPRCPSQAWRTPLTIAQAALQLVLGDARTEAVWPRCLSEAYLVGDSMAAGCVKLTLTSFTDAAVWSVLSVIIPGKDHWQLTGECGALICRMGSQ